MWRERQYFRRGRLVGEGLVTRQSSRRAAGRRAKAIARDGSVGANGELEDQAAAALARELGVRPQSMNEIIAPLERKRLLKREASREHQRILHMRLTSSGARLLAEALQAAARLEAELLAELDSTQLRVLQESLTRLWTTAADRLSDSPRGAPHPRKSDRALPG